MPVISPFISSVENSKTGTGNTALVASSTLVRSVQINPLTTNLGSVAVGFQNNPMGFAPITIGPYDNKWIDLADIVIKPDTAGEGVQFIGLL